MPTIIGIKNHTPVKIKYFGHDTTRPKLYERLPSEQYLGISTIQFSNTEYGAYYDKNIKRYVGGERTNKVALYTPYRRRPYPEGTINLDTTGYEHPLEAVLDALFDAYSEVELKPSYTKQREVRERSSDDSKRRDGRRQTVTPVVVIAYQLEHEIINLFGKHEQFRTALMVGAKSKRVHVSKYEVEIASLIPNGSAPSFEFFVRCDKRILRMIGRDLWAYLKMPLLDIVKDYNIEGGFVELDENLMRRHWESFTSEEMLIIDKYVTDKARVTRKAYEELTNTLTNISPYTISRDGLIAKSPATAAMRIATSLADEESWPKPPYRVMQMGAMTYAGPRVFGTRPGYYENIYQYDIKSMYPFVMTLLPGPNSCEYIDIEPAKEFDLEKWEGEHGLICISGNSLDKHYPAIREHDFINKSLRYIRGPFDRKWTTIAEVVIGVFSNRLTVSEVHGGIHIVGDPEKSFLARHARKMFDVKDQYGKGSPQYMLAKLLANAPSGKLAESNKDHRTVDPFLALTMVPIETYQQYNEVEQALVLGNDEFEDKINEIFKESEDSDEVVPFNKVFRRNTDFDFQAGVYYAPFHAAMITGMGSAMLGLAAHFTGAIIGHTDSLFTQGDQSDGLEHYRIHMEVAGYPVPEHGMGSFQLELSDAKGYLAHGGLFAVKQRLVDRETGEVTEVEQHATHGLVHIGQRSVYDLIKEYINTGQTSYETEAHSVKFMESIHIKQAAGSTRITQNTLERKPNPNMTRDEKGDLVWKDSQSLKKPFTSTAAFTKFHEDMLQDANTYLANSALSKI